MARQVFLKYDRTQIEKPREKFWLVGSTCYVCVHVIYILHLTHLGLFAH